MNYLPLCIFCVIIPIIESASIQNEAPEFSVPTTIEELNKLVQQLPPDLKGMSKGDAGKICVIGGSAEHSGPPYFTAITAMKVGADSVFVITPNVTSPIVKGYTPDPLVYPYFNTDTITKITPIITRSDVIVIGPGLGKEEETLTLTYDVINMCKTLEKPLVLDADGIFALSKNPTILKDYPGPVILTPNQGEAVRLIKSMALTNNSEENWFNYWGRNVSVMLKGATDQFFSNNLDFNWFSNEGGSSRRCPNQGDMLAGALGTFFNWALNNEAFVSNKHNFPFFSQSVASYAAAKLTRYSNSRAFEKYERNFIPSNMIENMHLAFKDVFDK